MHNKKLPSELKNQVRDYYRMRFQGGKLFEEHVIMKDLTPSLRQQVLEWNAKDMLTKVPAIVAARHGFARNVASVIVSQVAFNDELIYRQGAIASHM